jgi:hypothetical protein
MLYDICFNLYKRCGRFEGKGNKVQKQLRKRPAQCFSLALHDFKCGLFEIELELCYFVGMGVVASGWCLLAFV